MEIIRLQNIHFDYSEEINVFKGLAFSVEEGDRIGIAGPNGCGKTTLFLLIMGLLKPTCGEITLFGERMEKENDFKEPRRKIGYLFQDPDDQLFCPTVEEDIAFGPLNLGINVEQVKQDVDAICRQFKISELKKRISFKLSQGQKRLVSLAGILIMKPEVLILDEPIASVDEEMVKRITSYLKDLSCTLIITSHNPTFLNALCSKTYFFKENQLNAGDHSYVSR